MDINKIKEDDLASGSADVSFTGYLPYDEYYSINEDDFDENEEECEQKGKSHEVVIDKNSTKEKGKGKF